MDGDPDPSTSGKPNELRSSGAAAVKTRNPSIKCVCGVSLHEPQLKKMEQLLVQSS